MILQRELEAAFDRFRAAGDEHHMLEAAAAFLGDDCSQFFQGIGGEVVAIAMRDARQLVGNRGIDLFIAVADAIDGGAARSVYILLAIGVMDVAALGPLGLRKIGAGRRDAGGKRLLGHAVKSMIWLRSGD